jgi:hypothetical protein
MGIAIYAECHKYALMLIFFIQSVALLAKEFVSLQVA